MSDRTAIIDRDIQELPVLRGWHFKFLKCPTCTTLSMTTGETLSTEPQMVVLGWPGDLNRNPETFQRGRDFEATQILPPLRD